LAASPEGASAVSIQQYRPCNAITIGAESLKTLTKTERTPEKAKKKSAPRRARRIAAFLWDDSEFENLSIEKGNAVTGSLKTC